MIAQTDNSIELESDLKSRFNFISVKMKSFKWPTMSYIGMFAGAQKPKPFQRKRPNLSSIPAGKLPTLSQMRETSLQLYKGSYAPCSPGESRRLEYAVQHIFEGCNYFDVTSIRGLEFVRKLWSYESIIIIKENAIVLKPNGRRDKQSVEFEFADIKDWIVHDEDHLNRADSGIELISKEDDSESVFLGFNFIRDVKHTLEFYWNRFHRFFGNWRK